MAWSYTGNPASSLKDAVRFTVADTNPDEPYATDEEIAWALSQNSNNVSAASALIANALSAKFSILSDEEIGPLKFEYAKRAVTYAKIASRLESDSSTKSLSLTGIYGGGIEVSDKVANEEDNSLVKPRLFSDQFKPANVPSDLRLE